jgi:hypothetical protein
MTSPEPTNTEPTPEASGTSEAPTLDAQIAAAEAAGDWATAFNLKMGTVPRPAADAPIEAPAPLSDADLQAEINGAEESGDWQAGFRLKVEQSIRRSGPAAPLS